MRPTVSAIPTAGFSSGSASSSCLVGRTVPGSLFGWGVGRREPEGGVAGVAEVVVHSGVDEHELTKTDRGRLAVEHRLADAPSTKNSTWT
jgi:hypothetical protein